MKEDVISTVRCPKCKSSNLWLNELWKDSRVQFEQVNGVFDRRDGNLEYGEPYKVEAECTCGHAWTIRKAKQISDIIR